MSAPQIVMMWLAVYALIGFAVRSLFLRVCGGDERRVRISNVCGIFWPAIVIWLVVRRLA